MSEAPPLETDSIQSLIDALKRSDGDEGPAARIIEATCSDDAEVDSAAGHLQRCQECVELFAALTFNDALIELKLLEFPEELCVAAAKALEHNTTLERFSLGAGITDHTGLALARAIQANSSLAHFELDAPNTSITDQTGLALARAIQANSSLTHFLFGAPNTITDQTGLALARAIQANSSLTHFVFGAPNTSITDQTGLALASAIQANSSLAYFAFGAPNTITDQTGLALARAIQANSSLAHFKLYAPNTITDQTGLALARAIQANSSLAHFVFGALSTITDQTGLALARAIQANSSLTHFAFYAPDTSITDQTGLALASAIQANSSLVHFTFDATHSSITDQTSLVMERAFQVNVTCLEVVGSGNAQIFNQYTQRNKEVQRQRHALTELARCSADTGFRSFNETAFRAKVLGYFLPPRCKLLPIEFVSGKRGEQALPTSGAAAQLAGATPSSSTQDEAVAEAAEPALDATAPELDEKEEQLSQALNESLTEALQQESADVNMALLRSKMDAPPLRSPDGVVLWRLTSRSAEIADAILKSDALAECLARVEEAGCEVMPAWADGAILLVPMTEEQVLEAGLVLKAHNLVALEGDKDRVAEALRSLPCRRRPQIKPEHRAGAAGDERPRKRACQENAGFGASGGPSQPGQADDGAATYAVDIFEELGIVAERTFLHCPAAEMHFDLSDTSAMAQTEPGGGAAASMRASLRRQ